MLHHADAAVFHWQAVFASCVESRFAFVEAVTATVRQSRQSSLCQTVSVGNWNPVYPDSRCSSSPSAAPPWNSSLDLSDISPCISKSLSPMASATDKLSSAGKTWLKVNMLQVCHCRAVQTAMVFHVSMCITGVHIRMSNIEVDCNFKGWPQKDAQADEGPTVKADSACADVPPPAAKLAACTGILVHSKPLAHRSRVRSPLARFKKIRDVIRRRRKR